MNFHMFKLDLEKVEKPEIKLPTSIGSLKKQENSRKTYTSPILNQSVVSCLVLTVASWTSYRFLRRQVALYSHLLKNFPQFVVIYTVKGFGAVNEAEIDFFLELSCFLNESKDVSNLISGSSVFSNSSFNTWKFMVHVLLSLAWRFLSIILLAC